MATFRPGRFAPRGAQQVTSLSSAAALTAPTAGGANAALIQAETQDVRWRDDGTNPTTSVGNLLKAGNDMFYEGDLTAIRFVETTASAKLNVSYYEDTRGGQ